jgi:hypothetical protein
MIHKTIRRLINIEQPQYNGDNAECVVKDQNTQKSTLYSKHM